MAASVRHLKQKYKSRRKIASFESGNPWQSDRMVGVVFLTHAPPLMWKPVTIATAKHSMTIASKP